VRAPSRSSATRVTCAAALALVSLAAGCALLGTPEPPAPVQVEGTASPPSPDPRIGLAPGLRDAGQAAWNMRLLSTTPPSEGFVGEWNSDLAFLGDYVIQGNFNGYQVWNVADPSRPTLTTRFLCPASQSDVSVYRNLLFVSGEALSGRLDCGTQGVPDTVSAERLRGIRIVDAADMANPRYIGNVQTCRGSHTHTVVTDPDDPGAVYVYVSGSAAVRSPSELPGCSGLAPELDPSSALFRIEVIRVPLADPAAARIVSSPRIFEGLTAAPSHGEPGAPPRLGPAPGETRPGPTQCHDITAYPAIGRAGGACRGYGMLLDIGDAANPRRLQAVADSNFALWHSATFNNDGTKILFTDEWGGGTQPKCRATDPYEWGANAIFTLDVARDRMEFQSYYKIPAAQTPLENCVAHNGSLVPIPGRDVMVQAWYQGGISVLDFTDPVRPLEIAFFDRGPVERGRMSMGGSWSAYWYNGYVYSSEIARGLDVLELVTSPHLSQNELDAARSVRLEYFNAQEQPRFAWPPTFALARAYLDQLERSGGLDASRVQTLREGLDRAEGAGGAERRVLLQEIVERTAPAGRDVRDQRRFDLLLAAIRELYR
jgi:hypothetical protein